MTGPGPAPQFATFWHGPLDPIAYGCLASFAHFGADLRVYTYEPSLVPPRSIEVADARAICPDPSLMGRYLAGGKPSLAKFADLFRYLMIRQTGRCWVDADLVCLRRPDFGGEAIVFGRQPEAFGRALINNAVLRLPPDHPLLAELIRRAEAAVDVDQPWGAIGPFLLSDLAEQFGVDSLARDFHAFNPIEPDHFFKPLLAAWRADVAAAIGEATFLHLWGALLERAAYHKLAGPPVGSFLHEAFGRFGVLDRFERVYGERELESLLAKWMANDGQPGAAASP